LQNYAANNKIFLEKILFFCAIHRNDRPVLSAKLDAYLFCNAIGASTMPRKKRNSTVLEKVEKRLLGFRALDPNLDFGDGVTVSRLSQLMEQLRNQLDRYNLSLTELDSAKQQLEDLEKDIRETSERLVNGVAFRYGKDSREYEIIGGVRKSERARKASVTRLKSKAEAKPASQTA
jgi:DNA repair exonuclease SbcCD ATPase subunit